MFLTGGRSVSLADCRTRDEMLQRLRAFIEQAQLDERRARATAALLDGHSPDDIDAMLAEPWPDPDEICRRACEVLDREDSGPR